MKKSENAYLYKRLIAFLIDIVIVSFVVNLVSIPFINTDSVEKLSLENEKVLKQYNSGEIDSKTFINQSIDVNYELTRVDGIINIIQILFMILYFVVYQFYNNGQTIGKKLMKIKVCAFDDSELNINNYVVRGLINDFILVNMVVLGFAFVASKDVYFYAISVFEGIQYLVLIISLFMIVFSSDGRGIHDRISNTKVINIV